MDNQLKPNAELTAKLSEKWKKRFALLEQIGADDTHVFGRNAKFKELTWKEKMSVNTNILAFFFTFFYYGIKGMWLKAAFIFSATIFYGYLIWFLEIMAGTEFIWQVYWLPICAVCGQMANYDYYKFVKQGKSGWGDASGIFSNKSVAIALVVGALSSEVLIVYAETLPTEYEQQQNDIAYFYDNVSGVWIIEEESLLVTIDLVSINKTVMIGDIGQASVNVLDVDFINKIISLSVNNEGESEVWAIRQLYDEDGTAFTLQLTLHNGAHSELAFVRNL